MKTLNAHVNDVDCANHVGYFQNTMEPQPPEEPIRELPLRHRKHPGRERPGRNVAFYRVTTLIAVVALSILLTACQSEQAPSAPAQATPRPERSAEAAPLACTDHQPLRQALWGELHVHTGISMDAWMFGTRPRPADAYRFARGEAIGIGPVDDDGRPFRTAQLERPLDFAAVTDHAQGAGAVELCTTPGSASYDSDACQAYRAPLQLTGRPLAEIVRDIRQRTEVGLGATEVCGEDGARCRSAMGDVWQETRDAAEAWNDTSPTCEFTTFVAYEYTATPNLTKIHRNVIFRNATVPALPISYADEPEASGLWRELKRQCLDAGTGCDVLAIPHNANLSNGNLFAIEYGEAQTIEEQAEVARLRARLEPLYEISQVKGDSECRNGMWNVLGATDELCGYEKMRALDTPDCKDGKGEGALGNQGCISRRDFARYALVEGLMEAERIGVNPFPIGFIAATDGHDGTPGAVEEWRQDLMIGQPAPGAGRNPGGLAAVWAEENSRESLFEALQRRETYGTSGPRMTVRLFGGWDYPEELCGDPELVRKGYAGGVPMGGELSAPPSDGSPTFVVSALRDQGTTEHSGGLLQRVQIVKGWADAAGNIHQQVVDIAGGPNDATVDTETCTPSGPGANAMCGVWTDPEFDPDRGAVYYARVVENPSCRQTGWACLSETNRPAWCDMPELEKTVQERAWTSPIWYDPGKHRS
jgi:hypothetical protein